MNRDNVHMTMYSELKGRMLSYSHPQHVLPTEMTPVPEGVVVEAERIPHRLPAGAVYQRPIAQRGVKRKNGGTPMVFIAQMEQIFAVQIAAEKADQRNQRLRAKASKDPHLRSTPAANATLQEKDRKKALRLAMSTYVRKEIKSVTQQLAGTFTGIVS